MCSSVSEHEEAALPSGFRDLQQLQWWLLGFGDTDGTALISLVVPGKWFMSL